MANEIVFDYINNHPKKSPIGLIKVKYSTVRDNGINCMLTEYGFMGVLKFCSKGLR